MTLVRKNSRRFVPYWYSPYIPAWVGQLTVPTTVAVTGPSGQPETYHVFDIPDSLVGETDTLFDNIPDSDFHYTTIEFAFSSRRSSRLLRERQRRLPMARRAAHGRHLELGRLGPALAPIRSASTFS